VDAVFSAIENIVLSGAELLLFSVSNITQGGDSQGEVLVRLKKDGRVVNGQGADTDIVVASAKAYINALNRLAGASPARAHPQLEALGTP
jgi:2-isopropylmalate synthase